MPTVVTLPGVARRNPYCSAIGRTSPISLTPLITPSHRVIVAANPGIAGTRADRAVSNHGRRRGRRVITVRWTDLHSDRRVEWPVG